MLPEDKNGSVGLDCAFGCTLNRRRNSTDFFTLGDSFDFRNALAHRQLTPIWSESEASQTLDAHSWASINVFCLLRKCRVRMTSFQPVVEIPHPLSVAPHRQDLVYEHSYYSIPYPLWVLGRLTSLLFLQGFYGHTLQRRRYTVP